MIRRNLLFLSVFALNAFVLGFIVGCFAKPDNPPLYTYDTPILTQLSAAAHAGSINGKLYYMLDTHSMEPVLKGGDWFVVDTTFPYAQITKGIICTYQAKWLPPTAAPVTHRAQVKYPDGWVFEGDQNGINGINRNSGLESARVTEKEYIGKVVGIYRVKP